MKEDGGNAFPGQHEVGSAGEYQLVSSEGMSLRDYFAAKALHALMASEETVVTGGDEEYEAEQRMEYARGAYQYADAMLEARK